MSIVSRKAIQIAGPDKKKEEIVTFRKEANNTYTKIISTVERDYKTGLANSSKRSKPVEEGPYVMTSNLSDYDEKMKYQDFDGFEKEMFFKKVDELHEDTEK